MSGIRRFASALVMMPAPDIDTDQIIPARYSTVRSPEELAYALFRNRRDSEHPFVIDDPAMAGRSVLLAGPNFGCGSSREAAPWALLAGGFRAVVAPSFGDIFAANALKNGLLPIAIDPGEHHRLCEACAEDPGLEFVVDLPAGEWSAPAAGLRGRIRVDEFARHLLVTGASELDHLLGQLDAVEAYESGDRLHPASRSRMGAAEPPGRVRRDEDR